MVRGATSMAVATQPETEQVTGTESLCLLRNLLRCSISSISYLRGLFPEHCFYDRTLNGLRIKSLKPATDESQELCNWLESGVFPALKLGYVSQLVLGVYETASNELVESYHFQVTYPSKGSDGAGPEVKVHAVSGGAATAAGAAAGPQTKKEIKFSTITMMRTLTLLCQTLQPLVCERYIMMKLFYTDDTPADYEPLFFQPAPPDEAMVYLRRPIEFAVGGVRTVHHTYNLGMKTVLDGLNDGAEMGRAQAAAPPEGAGPYPAEPFVVVPSPVAPPSGPGSALSPTDDAPSLESDTARIEAENAYLEAELERMSGSDGGAGGAGSGGSGGGAPRISGGPKRVLPPPPDPEHVVALAFLHSRIESDAELLFTRSEFQRALGNTTKDAALKRLGVLRTQGAVAYVNQHRKWMINAEAVAVLSGANGPALLAHHSPGDSPGGSRKRRRNERQTPIEHGGKRRSPSPSLVSSKMGDAAASADSRKDPDRVPRARTGAAPVRGGRASVVRRVVVVSSDLAVQPISQRSSSPAW